MVFTDGTATAQTEQNAEQMQQETTPSESYLQKLVEAKGENWKDPEVLAKGKLEADGYIKTLEEQLAQMREDLKKQEYQAQVPKVWTLKYPVRDPAKRPSGVRRE